MRMVSYFDTILFSLIGCIELLISALITANSLVER